MRKGSVFPKDLRFDSGEAKPRTLRRSLSEDLTFTGKPEAVRTSGGEAARHSPLRGMAGPCQTKEQRNAMKRVTGIGGIFFKSQNPDSLREWYREHLGIESDGSNGASFPWREADKPDQEGMTVWSAFPHDTRYFDPSSAPFMINYRVANLDWLLAQLRAEGVTIDLKSTNPNTADSPGSWIRKAIVSNCGNRPRRRNNPDKAQAVLGLPPL